jgi:rhodanese-related sulfurtransferase
MSFTKSLGAGAVVMGLAAPFAGSPYLPARGRIDLNDIARVIAKGEDHVAPLQLAGWIRDRKPKLRVIDVRSAVEFADYSIPTAENIPLELLPHASFAPDEVLVLYSEGGAHAAQAWMMLRAMGHRNVYFIGGGLVDWYWDVMSPVLPPHASLEEQAAFARMEELSRYFGGVPQLGLSSSETSRTSSSASREKTPRIANIRRRGC